jgi:hypothetical protein
MADITQTTALTTAIQKLTSMAKWKKILIIISVVIIVLGGYGAGMYVLGVKSCSHIAGPDVKKDDKKDVSHVNKPYDKNSVCGTKIDMTASIDKYSGNTLRLKMFGKDSCKDTTSYFDINWTCPNLKWSVSLGLGLLVSYDSTGKKIYPQVGGLIGFQRHWSNLSLGPEIAVYSTLDKGMYSMAANMKFEYRF